MSHIYRGTDILTVIALREVTAAQWKLYSSLIKPRSQVQSQASSQNKKREPRIDSEKKNRERERERERERGRKFPSPYQVKPIKKAKATLTSFS